jgi:hypothetical protein
MELDALCTVYCAACALIGGVTIDAESREL